jgi:hypothetical protein
MNTYIIKNGVPLLPSREQRYPFGELEVGQSFEFQLHQMAELRSAAQWVGKKLARKFAVRKDRVAGVGRCWRVA